MSLGTEHRPPGPEYGYPAPVAARSSLPARRTLMVGVAGLALVVGVGVGVIAGVSLPDQDATKAAPSPTFQTPVAPALSPVAAQAQTCAVLRSEYESVANAIDGRNRFTTNDWSDPSLLAATNKLVAATSTLADHLDESLVPSTPTAFRAGVSDYVAALRALGTSQRNHAPSTQLNGVGEFYNQVVDNPLQSCGIPS